MYTLPSGVEVGCLLVSHQPTPLVMEWVEWMWRVALFLLTVGTIPGVRTGQANRDGCEVEQRWWAGGGSEV